MCVGVCTVWVNDGVCACVYVLCAHVCMCVYVFMSKCVSVCVVCTLCAHMHTRASKSKTSHI